MAGPRGGHPRPRGAASVVLAVTIVVLAVVTGMPLGERARGRSSGDLQGTGGEGGSAAGGPSPVDPESAYRRRCRPCHRLGGKGGTYGPDLDRSGRTLGRAFVRDYVLAPSALEPDARMPPTRGLSFAEAEALAAYVVETARRPRAAP